MDNDALERLSKKLDSRVGEGGVHRSDLHAQGVHAPHQWDQSATPPAPPRGPKRFSPLELLFWGSSVFFVIALVIAGILFFSGNNTVSTKNVDVDVVGPSSVGAGDTLSLQIIVTNRNAVPMELTDLIIEFPSGTRSDTDISVELPRIRESLGTIEPGKSVNRTVRAVIFGQADSNLSVRASVEYRVPSSNAVFFTDTDFEFLVNQSPASINVEALKEVVSGQETTLTVTVTSNASDTLDDMLLLADYPPGFTFVSSSPTPIAGSASWDLGDIDPGEKKKITIKAVFTGEDGDSRVVHFTTGNRKAGRDDAIAAPLATNDISLAVTKPFLSVEMAINGEAVAEQSVSRGEVVKGEVRWSNNLPVRVQDVEIELSLNGSILDKGTVIVDRGFYSSSNSNITWSGQTDERLSDVGPGESGVAQFSFKTLAADRGTFRNPEVIFTVTVRARRISEAQVPETLESTASARVVVATDLALNASVSRTGAFANTGPIPPKADVESTYTATWAVSNTANALADVSVTAILPSYIRWTGNISPSGESVVFNAVGRTITWTIGDMPAGGSKTVSFQVGITPSISQIGSSPTLVGDQRVYGFDRFVRNQIERAAASLTTTTGVSSNQGIVVP